jgi:disulfide bond formation protein DsbB
MVNSCDKIILALLLLVSFSALVVAFSAQVVAGFEPCILCKYQRIPYFAVILFSGVGLHIKAMDHDGVIKSIGVVFLLSSILAFYHNGVEQYWWTSIAGCGDLTGVTLSFEEFQRQLIFKMPKRCDQVNWSLFGLSMTVYNCVASLIFALFSFSGRYVIKNFVCKVF